MDQACNRAVLGSRGTLYKRHLGPALVHGAWG